MPKPDKDTQKGKHLAILLDEYSCKCPQQNTRKFVWHHWLAPVNLATWMAKIWKTAIQG
jgi:hypothetical protein